MKALVFGSTGQVARELRRRCPAGVEITALSRREADLSDPQACAAAISAFDGELVINAAAYTAVDRAEEEETLASVINGDAPAAMARAAAAKEMPFLHLSTDYVFEGSGEAPWHPDGAIAPLNAYGRSKRAGELGIVAAGGPHVILRTSWVFSAHGANFVKTMLRLSRTHSELRVVADQIGGPTAAGDIADALWRIAARFHEGQGVSGIYHFTGGPDTSWSGFAQEIFARSGARVAVTGIASSAYPTPACRPQNSRLDCTSLARDFGIDRPDWRRSLGAVLQDLKEDRP